MHETQDLLAEDLETFRAEEAATAPTAPVEQEPNKRFRAINRSQLMIRPVDVERLVEEDHAVRAIWAVTRRTD